MRQRRCKGGCAAGVDRQQGGSKANPLPNHRACSYSDTSLQSVEQQQLQQHEMNTINVRSAHKETRKLEYTGETPCCAGFASAASAALVSLVCRSLLSQRRRPPLQRLLPSQQASQPDRYRANLSRFW